MNSREYIMLAEARTAIARVRFDGCSMPLARVIHKLFKNSEKGCLAHDAGGYGLLKPEVEPGFDNDSRWFRYNWGHGSRTWALIGITPVLWYSLWKHEMGIERITPGIFWSVNIGLIVAGVVAWNW